MRSLNRHRIWQIAVDAALIGAAWYLAFALRFDYGIPSRYERLLQETIVVVIAVKISVFILFRLYDHWWRYLSIRDMWAVARAVTVASLLAEVVVYLLDPVEGLRVPRSIVVFDWLILLALVMGARLLARTVIERPGRRGIVARGKEALIVGAGDAGQLIIKEMQKSPGLGYTPMGLVDDDQRKRNMRLHGVRVLGTTSDLPHLLPMSLHARA